MNDLAIALSSIGFQLQKPQLEVLANACKHLNASGDEVIKAGKLHVDGLDESLIQEIIKHLSGTRKDRFQQLVELGQGRMIPELYRARGIAADYLRRMSVDDQARYCAEGVPCIVYELTGAKMQFINKNIHYEDLDQFQAERQCFTASKGESGTISRVKIRSISAQKKILQQKLEDERSQTLADSGVRVKGIGRFSDDRYYPTQDLFKGGMSFEQFQSVGKEFSKYRSVSSEVEIAAETLTSKKD